MTCAFAAELSWFLERTDPETAAVQVQRMDVVAGVAEFQGDSGGLGARCRSASLSPSSCSPQTSPTCRDQSRHPRVVLTSNPRVSRVNHEDRRYRRHWPDRLEDRRHSSPGRPRVVAARPKAESTPSPARASRRPMAGAQVVIDLANSPSFEDKAVLEFFETSGRNLLPVEPQRASGTMCAIHRRHRPEARQWLFPRQGRARETDRGLRHPLHHHPLDPVPGIPRRHRRFKYGWKRGQAFARQVSAHRADDVAARCRGGRSRRRETVSSRSPARNAHRSTIRRPLSEGDRDPREVVSDPEARYFGGRVRRLAGAVGRRRLGASLRRMASRSQARA